MSDDPSASPDGDQPPGKPAAWTRLIAPLRSEDAAFRTVIHALVVALLVIAVVVLVRLVT